MEATPGDHNLPQKKKKKRRGEVVIYNIQFLSFTVPTISSVLPVIDTETWSKDILV